MFGRNYPTWVILTEVVLYLSGMSCGKDMFYNG